jgi:hypothetical protein
LLEIKCGVRNLRVQILLYAVNVGTLKIISFRTSTWNAFICGMYYHCNMEGQACTNKVPGCMGFWTLRGVQIVHRMYMNMVKRKIGNILLKHVFTSLQVTGCWKKKGGGVSKPPPHGSVYDTGPCESLVLISFRLKIKY